DPLRTGRDSREVFSCRKIPKSQSAVPTVRGEQRSFSVEPQGSDISEMSFQPGNFLANGDIEHADDSFIASLRETFAIWMPRESDGLSRERKTGHRPGLSLNHQYLLLTNTGDGFSIRAPTQIDYRGW